MWSFISIYEAQFQLFLIATGFAYSQQVVLRAGVFSIATVGLAAIGAYATAILAVRLGVHPLLGGFLATLLGCVFGALLSVPLVRLRGVYQAIATLAFVQAIVALVYFFEPLTGGALGIVGIPRVVETWHLLIAVAGAVYLTYSIANSGIGRAFNAIRQDETVAATLGVSIVRYQTVAFVVSGGLAGLFGAFLALKSYSVEPTHFGFGLMTAILAYIVLGGRNSVWGPIVGCAILSALPEIARPLAEYRSLLQGAVMVLCISFLPHGIVDTLQMAILRRRTARADAAQTVDRAEGKS